MMKQNALNWFEIYVNDLDRAQKFYEEILAIAMVPAQSDEWKMAMFPCDEKGAGGAIMKMECCQPGPGGTLVYLNVDGELDAVISRIPKAGGKIAVEKRAIPPHGFIAVFKDPDGNMVGLHSLS